MRLLRRNKVTYVIECSCNDATKYVSVIDTQLGHITMCSVHRYAKRYERL